MADAFSTDLGIDVRVVTSIETAASIDEQANAMFEREQIGREAPVGGLLIVLNPRLGSARIEVGYTLEGALTDLHMSRIARDQLAPYASYGVAGMAVMDVLHYLRDHVYLSAALGRLSLPEDLRNTRAYQEYEQYVSGGAGARTSLASTPSDLDLKKAVPPERRARYAPAGEVQDSVEAFMRASADLAGDPTLELFTEGSRLLRSYYPLAPFEEARRLERLQASAPLQYIVQGDYAVATSKRPAQGFVPVLLHREDGLWRIDLVETWKNLFFDADGNYFLRNSNTPYAFALKQFGQGQYFNMHALPLRGVTLPRWLEALAAIGRGVEMSLADACNEAGDREGARHWAEQALAQNPYDLHALRWQRFLAERDGNQDEVQRMDAQLAKLMQDPERPYQPVMLYFKPEMPRFEADAPIDVEGTRVFDHSKFGVTIQNTSNRPVEIESVKLTSVGNEYLYFDKQWGFVKDTGHSHVRYVFHTCWHGVGTEVRQCRTKWVDAMPFIPNPQ